MSRDTEQHGILIHSQELPETTKGTPLILSLTSSQINQAKIDALIKAGQWLEAQGKHVKLYIQVEAGQVQSVRNMMGALSQEARSITVSTSAATGVVVYLLGGNDYESFSTGVGSYKHFIQMKSSESLFSVSGTTKVSRQPQGVSPQQWDQRQEENGSSGSGFSWGNSGRSTTPQSQPGSSSGVGPIFSDREKQDQIEEQKQKLKACADQLDKEIKENRGCCFFKRKRADKEIKQRVLRKLCQTSTTLLTSALDSEDLDRVVSIVAGQEKRSPEEIMAIVTKGRRSHRTKDVLLKTNILTSTDLAK